MTLSLARALAPEIRVNAVCPGVIQTRWWREGLGEERYPAFIEQYADITPLKAAGTPESVAEPVVWLLEGADHVTGETILVASGLHLVGYTPRQRSPLPKIQLELWTGAEEGCSIVRCISTGRPNEELLEAAGVRMPEHTRFQHLAVFYSDVFLYRGVGDTGREVGVRLAIFRRAIQLSVLTNAKF